MTGPCPWNMDNKDNIKTLLSLYEQHPVLYVVKSADYHNRTKRENAFRQICDQYGEITGQSITIEMAKKKLTNLRSQYLDYLNKIKTSKSSGMSTNDIYKPTWWLFEDMKFLDPHIAQRKGESSTTVSSKVSSKPSSSSLESKTAEESDNEDLQFLDVLNVLNTNDCDKENTDFNVQSNSSRSNISSGPPSVKVQCRKRKSDEASNANIAKDANANVAKDEFWTTAKNMIQTISTNDEDELKHWVLYLESKLRKIKDTKRLNRMQREIIAFVDEEDE